MNDTIHLPEIFAGLPCGGQPLIVERGEFTFRFVCFSGTIDFHQHSCAKALLVIAGAMRVEFADGSATLTLKQGDLHVIPAHCQHRPAAHGTCQLLLIEPTATRMPL